MRKEKKYTVEEEVRSSLAQLERQRDCIDRNKYAKMKKEILSVLSPEEALRIREEQDLVGIENWIQGNNICQEVVTPEICPEKCREALREMRKFVPVDVFKCTIRDLEKRGLPHELAFRILTRKTLWLCVTPKDELQRYHLADLLLKFDNQGLDLVEMRAIWAAIPTSFRFDPHGKKKEWRASFETKLLELEQKALESRLKPNELRHPAYSAPKKGSDVAGFFDPDLELMSTLPPGPDSSSLLLYSGIRKRQRSCISSSSNSHDADEIHAIIDKFDDHNHMKTRILLSPEDFTLHDRLKSKNGKRTAAAEA